jgi:HK97 gp10 family phage protein
MPRPGVVLHRDVISGLPNHPKVQAYIEQVARAGRDGAKRRAAVDTGWMRDHIVLETGPGFARWVCRDTPYAEPQEFGTWKMPAHPFMRPSVYDAIREALRIG